MPIPIAPLTLRREALRRIWQALAVRSENFYDEDAEPSTLKEVIEGIMQPLALRMIQRNGKVYVYDLNGLYSLAPSRAIEWDGDSQTMGVDKVANNVKVSFPPIRLPS